MRLQDLLVDQEKFLKYAGGCGSCPRALNDYVPPSLLPTKMILVGEAPSKGAVEKQEIFADQAGSKLKSALEEVGIREFSMTNTLHCRLPADTDPHPKEISCCMNQHVVGEVGAYPLVVLVGSTAMNAFFPGYGQLLRGNLAYHPDYPNSKFYGLIHPGVALHDKSKNPEFMKLVDRLGRIYRDPGVPFQLFVGEEAAARFPEMLHRALILSLDLETDRLESWAPEGRIKSLCVTPVPLQESYFIHEDDPFFTQALQMVRAYLEDPTKQVLGQNIGFDIVWLEAKLDFRSNVKRIYETQSLYYQLRGQKQVGLKRLVTDELDGYRHLIIEPHKEKNRTRLGWYNGEDTYYTSQLFIRDFPKLRPKTQDLHITVAGPSSLALRRITHAGIRFRSELWEGLVSENRAKRDAARDAWAAADPDFKPRMYVTPNGTTDIDDYLYKVKKYPVTKTTPKGDPSVDEEVLKELIRQGATQLEHLLTIRELDKEYSTYMKPYPKLVHPTTGRIHANYHNTSTDTGRTSSSDPNMQNVKRGPVRNQFGFTCELDWSQIELRLGMSLANEIIGIQAYKEGKDLHTITAQMITGRLQVTKAERTDAKPVNFGLLYGGNWETVQLYALNTYGIRWTDDQAKRYCEAFFSAYPRLVEWHNASRQKLRENKGYFESAVGHVWYYPDWDSNDQAKRSHAERAALNSECQGPAGYFTQYLIYLMQQEFYRQGLTYAPIGRAEPTITVHDQVGWDVDTHLIPKSIEIAREGVQQVTRWASKWLQVPLVADFKFANPTEAWAMLKDWEN